MIIFAIWAVVAAIIFGSGMFYYGREQNRPYSQRVFEGSDEAIAASIALSIFWPFFVLLSPFVALYFLGKYWGHKDEI